MVNITKRDPVQDAAVILSLEQKLPQLYTSRMATISKMSGYPCALHSIGRLQRSIKLTSYRDLLDSLFRVQNLAYITAEVIDSIDGTEFKKHQMDRSQVVALVTTIVSQIKNFSTTAEEIDMIAHLIVSFEGNQNAWVLNGAEDADDLHFKILDLYEEVLLNSNDDYKLGVFAPHRFGIVNFSELPFVKQMVTDAEKDPAKKESKMAQMKSAYTIYKYGCTRVIDHIYQLMLDKDIWYAFVAPRLKVEVQTNSERSKSLRNLAIYCQSLLNYHQLFSLEVFMKSYELVQTWVLAFPPIEATVINELEGTLRKYDLLNARGDANELINSFSKSAETDLHAVVFPSEFIDTFGIKDAIETATKKAQPWVITGDLTNIALLQKPQYLPLISGTESDKLDVSYKVANLVMMDKIVSQEVRLAMAGMMPSMTGGASEISISRFKALDIKASLEFKIPHACSYHIEKGVEKGIYSNKLHLDSAAPSFTYDYHDFVRTNLFFKFGTDQGIANQYAKFSQSQAYDWDRAAQLRQILKHEWKTLAPANYANGTEYFNYDNLTSVMETPKMLIEKLVGVNYELMRYRLAIDHIRVMFATFISSFGLLYSDSAVEATAGPQETFDPKKFPESVDGVTTLKLIDGYGFPYGTDYATLATLQGDIVAKTPMINIGYGLYIRMLTRIPKVSTTLRLSRADNGFYMQHPVMYFAAQNVEKYEEVDKWVISEGCCNFAMFPLNSQPSVPFMKFTPRYAFLTQSLYFNTDSYFRPATPDETRENYDINVTTSAWNDEKLFPYLEWRNLGKYSSQGVPTAAIEDSELVADAIRKIEDITNKEEDQREKLDDQLPGAVKAAHEKVVDEVEKGANDLAPLPGDKAEQKKRSL